MGYETVGLERIGHVAIMTLNRPEKLNAFNRQLTDEFHLALDEVAGEFPDTRALIITGAGRGFCSGADVSGQAEGLSRNPEGRPQEDEEERLQGPSILTLGPHIPQIPQPVIAAVNGIAAGAGLSIALACDIRIASEAARFSSIFIKRSLVPDNGASFTLAALAGQGIAAEMALTGRIYDAQWACQVGLVNRVVPADQLMEEARSLAEEIASNPPLAVKATKQLLGSHIPDLYHDVIRKESQANAPTRGTEDQREAVLSFIEKRQPVFKGR
jgi:2-(1,2-epoxy-1,2-dihydrophenyl)acetyl-CoA isomerase